VLVVYDTPAPERLQSAGRTVADIFTL